MAVVRAQCSFGADTAFARDRLTIVPHFNIAALVPGDSPGWQSFADDLCTRLDTWLAGQREVVVKVYDAEASRPNPPKATKTLHAGLYPASGTNRELSICLSYYAGSNTPRRRGRLYIPAIFTGSSIGVRPSSGQRSTAADIRHVFEDSGGINVDWVVWSRADRVARKVTNWWVDDEWDVQRRRGLRATTRDTGTSSG